MINHPASSANDIIKVGVLGVEEPGRPRTIKSNAPFHRHCAWEANKDAPVQQCTAELQRELSPGLSPNSQSEPLSVYHEPSHLILIHVLFGRFPN